VFDECSGGEDVSVLKVPKNLKIKRILPWILEERGERTAVYREERNDLGSLRQTNPPTSRPKPSRCPVSRLLKDEVRPRRTRPLVSDHFPDMS